MGVKQVDLICCESLGKFHPQEDGYCRWYIDFKIQLVCGLIYVWWMRNSHSLQWKNFLFNNEGIVTTSIHFESFKFCHLRIACFKKHARQYSFMIIFWPAMEKKICWELIVQMYKTHSFDNIRECAPINATKQNNAFTFWAPRAKSDFLLQNWLTCMFDQCISNKILNFFTHFVHKRGFYV